MANKQDSRHLIDPELVAIAEAWPPFVFSDESMPAIRAGIEQQRALAPAYENDNVIREVLSVSGVEGNPEVRLHVYRPKELPANAPALLYIHGGGFLFGAANMSDQRLSEWALELGCLVASVAYRLAPETKYPGQLMDAFACLKYLADNAQKMGIAADRIAIRGDSAGGGLAAALALYARDHDGPKISYQQLIYPMIDDRTAATIPESPYAGQYVWTGSDNRYAWGAMLGKPAGSDDVSFYAAPARAPDLSGLPPTLIATAAMDIFVDENIDYAKRLLAVGVPTELYIAPGAFHGFDTVGADAYVARNFNDLCVRSLKRHFATK